jgi:hypothetical protein
MELILNKNLPPISHGLSTRHINFLFVPRENKFSHSRKEINAFLKERRDYIFYDKEAAKILKEKAFLGYDFPNSYKFFWTVYINATVADFMGDDFYSIPVTKKGKEYYKLMKKGMKALGGFNLLTR